MIMAQKVIDISVSGGGMFGQYQAKARDQNGHEVAWAGGDSRDQAIARVVEKVRRAHPDAKILYP
jgi:glycerol-3-phosphate dehydrogenase